MFSASTIANLSNPATVPKDTSRWFGDYARIRRGKEESYYAAGGVVPLVAKTVVGSIAFSTGTTLNEF